MNETKKNEVNVASQLWFLVRWATGFALDILIFYGAILITLVVPGVLISLPEKTLGPWAWVVQHPINILALMVALFTALMAGKAWARSQYFTHILPEVWANTIRDLITKAKQEHGEDEE